MPEAAVFASPTAVAPRADSTPYAAFLSRFFAFLIDQFLAGAMAVVVYLVMASLAAATSASTMYGRAGGLRVGTSVGASFFFLVLGGFLSVAVYVYYFVKQETGPRQATLGKSLLGMKITTLGGARISIGQSVGRLIIKCTISTLFFALGFIMAAFTERKQALHDIIVGSIVVRS